MSRPLKYNFDTGFLKNIDNETKAYFLGLLYADGNHYRSKYKYSIRLRLHKKDIDIVEKFKLATNSEKPIHFEENGKICGLELNSRELSDDAFKVGLVTNKTFKVKFPDFLDDDLIRHFIRGYFDGDGSLSLHRLKCGRYQSQVAIVGTKDFCESCQDIIKLACDCNFQIYKVKTVYQIMSSGNRQTQRFLDYLYDGSNYYLNRKHRLYEELCLINSR